MSIFKEYKYFSSFEAGNCVSNSSFKWRKQYNQFSRQGLKKYWWLEPVNMLLSKMNGRKVPLAMFINLSKTLDILDHDILLS